MAFIRDMYSSYTYIDEETKLIILHLQKAIEIADQRALNRHGYSGSEEEQKYKPPYLSKE